MGTNARPDGFGAVILAGGAGRRLGAVDKAGLVLGGRTLLARALDAVQDAEQIVVVGPTPVPAEAASADGRPPVRFTRESPPGGGPAAGLLAGCDALAPAPDWTFVMAVDMPGVTSATAQRLVAALRDHPAADGAFLHAPDGRRQLAGILRRASLDRVRPAPDGCDGLPLHRLLDPLDLIAVPAEGEEGTDVDTWADLKRHE